MQIIQSIRDKGAAIVITVIALSLIGFLLMDTQQGGNQLFSSISNNVGKVNGTTIEIAEFNRRVKLAEDMEEQRSGQRPGGTRIYQIRDQVWNQMVAEIIFFEEAEKLGISFTSKELSALLLSNDQANPFLQQGFADPQTGKLDIAKAQQALGEMKKAKGAQREMIDAQIIEPSKLSSIVAKYSGMITASAYFPSWMDEKEAADKNNFATISYVGIPYSDISDSAVTVSDADVKEYITKNEALFKQEAGRKISYVSFSQLPSADDSARVRNLLEQIKPSFVTDTNAQAFVARNVSAIEYSDKFLPKSKISSGAIDTISKQAVGSVYGPYADQGSFVLAKMIGTMQMPDSVKARHILIQTNDIQSGQPIMEDSVAKKRADSILTAIKGGADFADLSSIYGSDVTKDKGGDLGFFDYGSMWEEFSDFVFSKPVGTKDVVRSRGGWHVIEITSAKGSNPAYKIAFVAKEITASDVTINQASLQATKASAEKDATALRSYLSKAGIGMTQVPNTIKENDYAVGALQDARQLVKWAFEADKNDVSEPFNIGDQFVVAVVDKVEKEGLQDVATARSGAEAMIRKQKKAKIIRDKLGANPTIESAASAYSKQILQAGADSSLTFSSQIINSLGVEPKLIGASFNKGFQAKPSPAIEGTNAVYIMKVLSIQAKPAIADAAARQGKLTSLRGQLGNWYEGLRKQSTIKDKRSEIF